MTNMTTVWVHRRPITSPVHHARLDMTQEASLEKTFTVLVQVLEVRWVSEYFVEVGAGI